MISNILVFSLLASGGPLSSKFKKLLGSVVVTPEKQQFLDSCQASVDAIKALQDSAGEVNKDNLKTYWDARLLLETRIVDCANIQTEAGSDLQADQKAALDVMYAQFVAQHKVVDTHGQPSFFDPSYQQLFDESIPLVDTHQACNPELMKMVEPTITKSWLLADMSKISEQIAGKTPLTAFEAQLKSDYTALYNIAKKKSDTCINAKLENVRPYGERAPASVRKEWESAVQNAFTAQTDIPIVRIVFTTPEFKRFTEEKTEVMPNGDLKTMRQDYDAMDVMVYARNGEFVDGFIVTLYKDRIQNSEYARFYGFDAQGNLQPAHRVLPQNMD